MKRFSSQYLITNRGTPLKRAIITADDEGTIINIEDTSGNLQEKSSVEFHNGIIIPGFVNSHCHLELSHLRDNISRGSGIVSFIDQIRNRRTTDNERIITAAKSADRDMYKAGVNLCADICNTSHTFSLKKESRIRYINLLEVFGIDPVNASQRMAEVIRLSEIAAEMDLPFSMVPHSVYSLSLPLFRLLRDKNNDNKVTSIHFMESPAEADLVSKHSGPLLASYIQSGLLSSGLDTVKSHADAVMNEITRNGNLILVHNTFADSDTVKSIKPRGDLFWCLCPKSNLYIENKLPPVDPLLNEGCEIIIGTDSLASNNALDILDELKTLQADFPSLTISQLVLWATLNGARALGMDQFFGTIEVGRKPGLLLLQNVDLQNMKLLPDSFVTRLI